ncbi:MAG: hypothetical protein C0467_10885 [Planctomycetaceae bacterium]|nr:hypothetical protein [Planctomycetaceae bacterium]
MIFGLLGVAGSGALGVKWMTDISEKKPELDRAREVIATSGSPDALEKVAKLDRLIYTTYTLLAGAVLGLLGCVLVFTRKGAVAAAVFFVAFVTPLVVAQDIKPGVITSGLALAILFSFFVKPLPVARRKREPGIPVGTDMV